MLSVITIITINFFPKLFGDLGEYTLLRVLSLSRAFLHNISGAIGPTILGNRQIT